jgi:hypothetical protein
MADNKRTSEKVQVDNIEQNSGQEREVSSSNIQNDAVSSPSGESNHYGHIREFLIAAF